MKYMITRSIVALSIGIFVCSSVSAQENIANFSATDKYVISAKAGGVNYTEGNVTVIRPNGKGGLLIRGDQLEIGDQVSTADGRIEVLMNPGSYLRLGANSAFEFKTTSLDDLQLKLNSGSAILEVFAADEFRVTVFTPMGKAVIVDSGVYRVDVSIDGAGTIAVTEGKAKVGVSATVVKKGRTATIGTETVAITKFDGDKRDELAEWSRTRAKDLAKMTSSLKNRDVRDSLISSFNSGRWGMFDSFGLWIFNPFYRAFCFMPFGYEWYSPYGFGFGPGIYRFNLPTRIIMPPSVAGGPIKPNLGDNSTGGVKQPAPPYTKIEKPRDPIIVWDDVPSAAPPIRNSAPATSVPTSQAPASPAPLYKKRPGN